MSRKKRIFLSLSFAAAFFMTAPLVLLYTAGYRYDFKKNRVEKTGIIQADSLPQGARIILNDAPQKRTTPASFTRLLPEDYRIRFEKDGYFPWKKTVEVRSTETTFVTDALLFRDSLPRLVRENELLRTAFTKDARRAALLTVNDGKWTELSVLEAGKEEPVLLARYGRDAYSDEQLLWSPDGTHLLLSAHDAKGAAALILYDASAEEEPRALHADLPAGRLGARWSTDGARIAAVAASGVFLVNPVDGTAAPALLDAGVRDAILRENSLFLLTRGKQGVNLVRRTGDPASWTKASLLASEIIAVFPESSYGFLDGAEDGPYLLIADAGKRRLLVVSPDDGRIIDTLAADRAAWLPKSKEPRLLAWNDFEITVSDVQSANHTLVTRLGTPILGCAWHPSGLAVFYSTATSLEAAELDARDERNVFDLVRFGSVGAFAVDAADAVVRFEGAAGSRRGIYEKEY